MHITERVIIEVEQKASWCMTSELIYGLRREEETEDADINLRRKQVAIRNSTKVE